MQNDLNVHQHGGPRARRAALLSPLLGIALFGTALAFAASGPDAQKRSPVPPDGPLPTRPAAEPATKRVSDRELIRLGLAALDPGTGPAVAPALAPAFDLGREGVFVSQLRAELLRFSANDHGVDVLSGELRGEGVRVGRWEIGRDALPSLVTLREIQDGHVLASARVADGMRSLLCIGLLRWERGRDGDARLRTVRTAVFSGADVGNGERIAATESLESLVPLDWDAARDAVLLAAADADSGRVLELEAALSATDLPVPMDALRPWAGLVDVRVLPGRDIGAGVDVHAAGDDLLVRVREGSDGLDGVDSPLPLSVLRRDAAGGWTAIARASDPAALRVGPPVAGWVDEAGTLHVAALQAAGPGGGADLWVSTLDASAGTWSEAVKVETGLPTVGPRRFLLDARPGTRARVVLDGEAPTPRLVPLQR